MGDAMKRSLYHLIFGFCALAGALLLSGCAAAYSIQMTGYTDPATPAPFAPGDAFFVIDNQEAKNPLLDREIKAKINALLAKQGYVVAPFEQADYYLFFTYGIGPSATARVAMPDYAWGFSLGYGYYHPRSYGFFWPGFAAYPGYREPLYDRWLLLNVVEGRHYRESGQFRTVWVGETRSTGTSADIREVINSLLVGAFARFGHDTRKAVIVDLDRRDPRLLQLETVR
jgi:hypothetical protein